MSAWVPSTTRQFDLGRRAVIAAEHYRTVAQEFGHVGKQAKAARALRDMATYDAVKAGWPKGRLGTLTGLEERKLYEGLWRAHRFDVIKRTELRLLLERMAGA